MSNTHDSQRVHTAVIPEILRLNLPFILANEKILYSFILSWQLSDYGFCQYHLMTKAAIT